MMSAVNINMMMSSARNGGWMSLTKLMTFTTS